MGEILKPPNAEPVPTSKEGEKSKELLNGSRAGLQGALLLDAVKPGVGINLNKNDLQKVKSNIESGQSFETTKITNSSKLERTNFWKENYKEATSFDDQKKIWVDKTNEFLNYYYDGSPEKEGAKEVLNKLGMRKDGAGDVYNEYFGAVTGKGEVGYFASKAARELSYEQIRDHGELLVKIGGFYGKDSAEVAKLLAEGAKNLKENSETFIPAAEEGFNNLTDEDKKILDGVHQRSEEWRKGQGILPIRVEPKPDAPKPEGEKGIKDSIEPLFNFDKEIAKIYHAESGLTFAGEESQRKVVRESDSGIEAIDKYNKDYEEDRAKIAGAVNAKEISYVVAQYDALTEGDIVDLMPDKIDILMKYEGKVGNEYKFRQCGPGKEFEPMKFYKEDEIREKKFSKIEFAGEEKKPTEPQPKDINKLYEELSEELNKIKNWGDYENNFGSVTGLLKEVHKLNGFSLSITELDGYKDVFNEISNEPDQKKRDEIVERYREFMSGDRKKIEGLEVSDKNLFDNLSAVLNKIGEIGKSSFNVEEKLPEPVVEPKLGEPIIKTPGGTEMTDKQKVNEVVNSQAEVPLASAANEKVKDNVTVAGGRTAAAQVSAGVPQQAGDINAVAAASQAVAGDQTGEKPDVEQAKVESSAVQPEALSQQAAQEPVELKVGAEVKEGVITAISPDGIATVAKGDKDNTLTQTLPLDKLNRLGSTK